MGSENFEDEEHTDPALYPPTVEAHLACALSFSCPQRWSALTRIAEANQRHCSECDRDVHLVWNQELFEQAARDGLCAAIVRNQSGDQWPSESPEERESPSQMGELRAPQEARHKTPDGAADWEDDEPTDA